MTRALLLVLTSNTSGSDPDEFNTWYDAVHIPQILKLVSGVVAASRYTARVMPSSSQSATEASARLPHPFAAIYEIDADDPQAVVAEIGRRAANGEYTMSPTLDRQETTPLQVLLIPFAPASMPSHSPSAD